MTLLFVGFAVGVLAAFLLRTLVQIEKDGMARVAQDVSDLVDRVERMESRIETLEAIAVSEDAPGRAATAAPPLGASGSTDPEESSRPGRLRNSA